MCFLSYVYVYRIEYVSYRQGPHRIHIVSAADRIVPALLDLLVKGDHCYNSFISEMGLNRSSEAVLQLTRGFVSGTHLPRASSVECDIYRTFGV